MVNPHEAAPVVVARARPLDLGPDPELQAERERILKPLMETVRGRSQILASMFHPLRNLVEFQERYMDHLDHLVDAIQAQREPLRVLTERWSHDRTLAGSILIAETMISCLGGGEEYDEEGWEALLARGKRVAAEAKPYTDQVQMSEWLVGVCPDHDDAKEGVAAHRGGGPAVPVDGQGQPELEQHGRVGSGDHRGPGDGGDPAGDPSDLG